MHIHFSRSQKIGSIAAVVGLAALLYLAWSAAISRADVPQIDTPMSFSLAEAESPVQQDASPTLADRPPAPLMAAAGAPSEPSSSITPDACAADGTCPPLAAAACNTVVHFDTRIPQASNLWNDYNCLDHSVFPAGSLTYDEVGYDVTLGQVWDLSLAVPLVMSDGLNSMNVFAGILTDCDNNACIAGGEHKDLVIHRHAIYTDAPAGVYTTVVDSDNMNGTGDMIIACGNPNPGWCAAAYSNDITCNDYTINGTTQGGPDNIIFYDAVGWTDNYAYDGPERVYRIQVADTSFFSFTLHYSGSQTLPYNNYMSYFILDNTCDQRNVWDNPRYPEPLFVGETTTQTTSSVHIMRPGTYYLVVDGMHLPTQGDAFQLDVQCAEVSEVYLPLTFRDYPPIPTVTVDPQSGPGGTEFHLTGTGFTPNETVSHWLIYPNSFRQDFSDFQADSHGSFANSISTPSGSQTGIYTYRALGDQSQHEASVQFEITAGSPDLSLIPFPSFSQR
jgi:hypothetical protein